MTNSWRRDLIVAMLPVLIAMPVGAAFILVSEATIGWGSGLTGIVAGVVGLIVGFAVVLRLNPRWPG